jgi:putative SOS response-associated peptidase YedK
VCGRFRDERSWSDLHAALVAASVPVAEQPALNLEPRAQVRPTNDATIVRLEDGQAYVRRARWWLIPWFYHGELKKWRFTTFNARAETVATARTYKESFARRRCLVSASGWYEWTGPKGEKQPWLFGPANGEPIAFAGIWDRCETRDAGIVESCTIITQPAGSPLNGYHDRAPVVLFQKDWARWLNLDADGTDLLGSESVDCFSIKPANL